MTNEEKKIKQLFGNENHFHVPEGYFDKLSEQILAKIPEEESAALGKETIGTTFEPIAQKVILWRNMPIRKIAASVIVVALLGGGLTLGLKETENQGRPLGHAEVAQRAQTRHDYHENSATASEEAEFEQMADYAMMDNQDIYASLIAEN